MIMRYSVMIFVDAESKDEAIEKRCEGQVHSVGVLNTSPIATRIRTEVKPEPWPLVLIPLKALAKEGDRGSGDIIARTVGPIGGEAFKKWYKLLFGKDCGCGNRQEALNRRWPL